MVCRILELSKTVLQQSVLIVNEIPEENAGASYSGISVLCRDHFCMACRIVHDSGDQSQINPVHAERAFSVIFGSHFPMTEKTLSTILPLIEEGISTSVK